MEEQTAPGANLRRVFERTGKENAHMRRIMLTVAYDGTNYSGWQLQPNSRTIEAVLNRAISELIGEKIEVVGASRTDSGVHALGNICIFDTEKSRIPGDKFAVAINQRLPEDIRVQRSEDVPEDFHPRKVNGVKTYVYRILNRKTEDPTRRLNSTFCYFDLDLEKMRSAAAYLIGEHDFASFCAPKSQAVTTVRRIYSIDIEKDADDMVTIRISGGGFLYNMVRIIAGTLMRVGTGLYEPEHVEEILEAKDRQAAGPTAPAKGLTMESLVFEKEPAPEVWGENIHYSYTIDQRSLLKSGNSMVLIHRCEEEEFAGLTERSVHQAFRNGAKHVFVKDEEKTGRIRVGQVFGLYRISAQRRDIFEAVFCGKETEDDSEE